MNVAWRFFIFLIVASAILGISFGSAQAEMPPLRCASVSITCVAIDGSRGRIQHEVPVTFGQPFVVGDVPKGAFLKAVDDAGKSLPFQMDRISSHPDGSVRFAILTTMLPELKDRDTVSLSLSNERDTAPFVDAAALLATQYDLNVDVTLYSPQVTQIIFGDRNGAKPGTPFQSGEIVSVMIGDDAADRYTVKIGAELTGGDFTILTKIAQAMGDEINKGQKYRAYKIGEGGGYEKLWVTTRDNSGRPFAVKFSYSGRAMLSERTLQNWAETRRYTASVRPALAKLAARPETWLKGSVATEFSLTVPFRAIDDGSPHPQLTALFGVRSYAGGQRVRTDVVLENNWAYEDAPRNLLYDIVITGNDAPAYRARNVGHYRHARWHKVVWSGSEPTATVRYDIPYFLNSRIVWNYDRSIRIPESVLAREAARLAAADTGPMGPAFITPYMPTTGGREDIAPLPRWTVLYLLSQDPRARAAMLANADASGGIPIHYRDRPTGQPVSIDLHPGIMLFLGKPRGGDGLPNVTHGDTPWTPDTAHQPSLAYVPYLVTGDRFYLDELLFWANWNMGGIDPGYREGSKGLLRMNQIRGQAWSLRTLGEAVLALPDAHPMKAYFSKKLQNNLQWYVDTYPRSRNREHVSPLGWVERSGVPGSTAPWQADFLALVTGHLAEVGFPLADEFFRWQAQSTVGRWTHHAEGYCWTAAPGYYINVRTKTGRAIQDWRTLFRENWPDISACPARFPVESYPESAAGSVAFAKAMLALSSDLNIPGAREAFQRLHAESSVLVRAQSQDPSWAIVPRSTNSRGTSSP